MKYVALLILLVGIIYLGQDWIRNQALSAPLSQDSFQNIMDSVACENNQNYLNDSIKFAERYYDESYIHVSKTQITGLMNKSEKVTNTKEELIAGFDVYKGYKFKCGQSSVDIKSFDTSPDNQSAKVHYIQDEVLYIQGAKYITKVAGKSECKSNVKQGKNHPVIVNENCIIKTSMTRM